jgi:DNA-binding NarL/FixJ family response regulator
VTVVAVSRPATLVARRDEVQQALHGLQFGAGVLLVGEAGIGKTALAAAVIDQLPTPPLARLVATAAGRSIPFGALSSLLPLDLTAIHPALVVQQLTTRLRHSAGPRRVPPVLVVDDAQLLDPQSAAALLTLVTSGTLRLLATVRSGSDPSDAVTALWKEHLVERIDLTPFDRAATRELLESVVGGPVASGTVEMLWSRSGGNPLYLSELARYGLERGALAERSGVWWWLGGTGLPPRLGELLQGRLEAASPAGSEAIDVLAMGEPLPYDTLAAVAGEEAILELDRLGLVTNDESEDALRLRFAHPLLLAVAERRLSPARRRVIAGRLRLAPAEHVDVIRRAGWEESAGGGIDVDLMLRAADAALIHDPAAAAGFAERALAAGGGLRAGLMVAAARSELGQAEVAGAALQRVAPDAATDPEKLRLFSAEFAVALWGRRNVHQARQVLDRARSALPAEYRPELLAAEAIAALFSAACDETVVLARAVLDEPASPTARIRALTALTGALTFSDRGPEAVGTAQHLLDELDRIDVPAPSVGLAHALVGVTGLFFGAAFRLPHSVGRLGRWPGSPDPLEGSDAALPAPPPGEQGDLGWPLLVGVRRHLQGDLVGALGPLREAYVQQHAGEGLFRSEATAELIFVLAELGRREEARQLLAEHPPDQIAIIPGLLPWARAAVAAADGRRAVAGDLAARAARLAAARGAAGMALNFLVDAGRWGDPRLAAVVLSELALPLTSDLQRVRAADILTRGSGSPSRLLEAAEIQLMAGFSRHALELAEIAVSVDDSGRYGRRITAVLRQARQRLGDQATSATTPAAGPLTQRESEVARLAARGSSDRQIADELVVSVRTVQSHLASAYRKLGIRSRTELVGLT